MHVNDDLGKHVDRRCCSHFWNIIRSIIVLLTLACCRVFWNTLLLKKNGEGSVESWGRRWLHFVWQQADFKFILKEVYLVHFCWVKFLIIRIKRDTSVTFYARVNIRILRTVDDVTIVYLILPPYGTTAGSAALVSEYYTSAAVEIRSITVCSSNCSCWKFTASRNSLKGLLCTIFVLLEMSFLTRSVSWVSYRHGSEKNGWWLKSISVTQPLPYEWHPPHVLSPVDARLCTRGTKTFLLWDERHPGEKTVSYHY